MVSFPILIPIFSLGIHFFKCRYERKREALRKRGERSLELRELLDWYYKNARRLSRSEKPDAPNDVYQNLMYEAKNLNRDMSIDDIKWILTCIIEVLEFYNGQSISPITIKIREELEDWSNIENTLYATERFELDQQFGSSVFIRPTALGNIIESYSSYPFKRYGMEQAEVLWPRLQHVIESKFWETIQDSRILLDFCLTMATLCILFGLLASLGGPWIWLNWKFWTILAAFSFLFSYIFYRLGILVAMQYGDLVRASFDLFRLDLLDALYREHPKNLEEEKQKWSEMSQLFVFGDTNNFEIRPRNNATVWF
jgi:hypothetical protein